MKLERVLATLIMNLDLAQRNPHVKKPFSWALYQTWKLIDQFEKERNYDDRAEG